MGVQTSDGRTASVYSYADVPDFNGDALSLSGLVVSATPSPKQASKETVSDLTPVSPTARRRFRRGDRAVVFVRLYQGGSHDPRPVTMTTRLVDASNNTVSDQSRRVDAASFTKRRSYDYRLDLPVDTLAAGEYLLTIGAAAGGKNVQRAVRFRVQSAK
jgi:hypothetical protein